MHAGMGPNNSGVVTSSIFIKVTRLNGGSNRSYQFYLHQGHTSQWWFKPELSVLSSSRSHVSMVVQTGVISSIFIKVTRLNGGSNRSYQFYLHQGHTSQWWFKPELSVLSSSRSHVSMVVQTGVISSIFIKVTRLNGGSNRSYQFYLHQGHKSQWWFKPELSVLSSSRSHVSMVVQTGVISSIFIKVTRLSGGSNRSYQFYLHQGHTSQWWFKPELSVLSSSRSHVSMVVQTGVISSIFIKVTRLNGGSNRSYQFYLHQGHTSQWWFKPELSVLSSSRSHVSMVVQTGVISSIFIKVTRLNGGSNRSYQFYLHQGHTSQWWFKPELSVLSSSRSHVSMVVQTGVISSIFIKVTRLNGGSNRSYQFYLHQGHTSQWWFKPELSVLSSSRSHVSMVVQTGVISSIFIKVTRLNGGSNRSYQFYLHQGHTSQWWFKPELPVLSSSRSHVSVAFHIFFWINFNFFFD